MFLAPGLDRYRKDGSGHHFPTLCFEICANRLYAISIFSPLAPNGFPIAAGSRLSPSLQGSNAMRNILSTAFQPLRIRRIRRGSRQMREKRTAWVLIVFSVLLACVELYIVYAAL
ncbi:hypothetical protein IE4803_CH01725 [Rhizobium etli bv. phaseoli str. IE4803]|uniref:Uncharacterized protein n=1 Tax=Rhizobium etli bv. mimosae str. IE4771 TaxID=1432050 RepID=A0A060HZA3_RHIET|nr:hypothetical protein IE4771_CH01777 [Rhizobium sp. IE4771]AJC78940.1 hypothetical protein IE4803_CH01725 [Rhizobium etli bv. phaseoli str. IE4803]